jgi:5'(3')-deoxyribonucleotidase|tara:strand:+ start:95 stop:544 length:450 start_codon:yes stop_codon:yes gene_type:complete
MDGVLVDFGHQVKKAKDDPNLSDRLKNHPDQIPDIFKDPPVYHGAIEAVNQLYSSNLYDLFIATTAAWFNPMSFTHKRLWIEKHFGQLFKKKMIITHRKDLLIGDYLIDDRLANGAKDFEGKLLRFGYDYENKIWNEFQDWNSITKHLL